MCQVVGSFATSRTTTCGSPLKLPVDGVERLGQQLLVPGEEQVAIGVDGVGLGLEQEPVDAAVDRGVYTEIVRSLAAIVIDGQIQEVLAVRKKGRPAMRRVLRGVESRERGNRTAVHIDAGKATLRCGRPDDDAIGAPVASASEGRIGDGLDGPAGKIGDFQFSVGEERDGAAVERPERKDGVLRLGQCMRFQGFDRSNPEAGFAVGSSGGRICRSSRLARSPEGLRRRRGD